jgi:uncharacterized membrane protein
MGQLANRNTRLILGGILLFAFALRLYNADRYGLFFDEKSTLLISQGVCLEGANQQAVFSKPIFTPAEFWQPKTFADFIEANIRGDIGNSPAYYGVLWCWINIFGMSDLAIRFPSIIFSTLTVLLLFIFVRTHFRNERLALLAAGVAAIEPFFVAHAQVARNYSMTFFLTLLATHVFLLLMRQRSARLILAYGLIFVTSVLSHYLAITVFLCHGIYAALYLRNAKTWLSLAVTGAIGLGLVSLWFVFGGGKYTFFTLNYQAQFYRNIALTNPTGSPFGTILPATIPNIAVRAVPIFADLFVFTNGLGAALTGLKNAALALALGGISAFLIHRYQRDNNPAIWLKISVLVVLALGLPVYSVVPLRFLVLSVAPVFVYLIARYGIEHSQVNPLQAADNQGINTQTNKPISFSRLTVLLLLLAFVPTLFLLFMAWRSGHTFGITQRYSGFSFPYVCILVAMGLLQLSRLRWWFAAPIGAALAVQAVFVAQVLGSIYAGQNGKYTQFEKPRLKNPYWTSAQTIKEQYAPGDTVVYPSMNRVIYSEEIDKTTFPYAVLDAQLVTVYLPKNAQYTQRIDANEHDNIVLIKAKTGHKVPICDLKENRY